MSVEAPGPKKSPLEKFSEAPDAARASALQLAAWRHSNLVNPPLSPDEQDEIVQHVDSAIRARRDLERGLRLSTGRQLQQVGAPTILNNAMQIVHQAEHVVAERFEHAWAANIAPKNSTHDLVEEIAGILDSKNAQSAFRTARVNSAHIQRLSEKDAAEVLEGVTLFGTLPHGSLSDEDAVTELIEHWNTVFLLPTRHPPDIVGRNTHDDEVYAKQIIKGQKILNDIIVSVPRVKSELNDDERWALAEYYGDVKRAWMKKRAHKRFKRSMPAIETLVAKVEALRGEKPEGRLKAWFRKLDNSNEQDEEFGNRFLNPKVKELLEQTWGTDEEGKIKLKNYLRLFGKVHGRTRLMPLSSAEVQLWKEVDRLIAPLAREAGRVRRPVQELIEPGRTSATPSASPENRRALPTPESDIDSSAELTPEEVLRRLQ